MVPLCKLDVSTGDLVEVAFLEGSTEDKFSIGAKGGFNSTLAPHYYFKQGKPRVFLTNPELRADLDGLILASNVRAWSDKYRNLKVSQILDAYYSDRGVFSTEYRACNRNKFNAQYAPSEILKQQTVAFAELYNKDTTFGVSPDSENIKSLTSRAVDAYNNGIGMFPKSKN